MGDEGKPNGHDDAEFEPESTESVDAPQPLEKWDRLRDESPRAYQAFKLWLNMERRSLTEVGQKLVPPCSAANVARWSTRHRWQDRAWAYDVKQEEEQHARLARERVSMRDRHLKVALALQGIAAHGIREWQAKIASGAALDLTPEEVKSLVDSATKLERQTVGVDKSRQYTKIVVNMGRTIPDRGERCTCGCVACQQCHGHPGDPEMMDGTVIDADDESVIEADEQKKLN